MRDGRQRWSPKHALLGERTRVGDLRYASATVFSAWARA